MSLHSALERWDKKRIETFSRSSVYVARQVNDWAKDKKKVAVIGMDKAGRLAVFSINEALAMMGRKPNKTLFMNMSRQDLDETEYQRARPMKKKEYKAWKNINKFRIAPMKVPVGGWKPVKEEDAKFFISKYVKQHAPELKRYNGILIVDDWTLMGESTKLMKEAISKAAPKADVKTAAIGTSDYGPKTDFYGAKGGWYALEMESVAPIREKTGVFYIKAPGRKAYLVKKPVTMAFPERAKEWDAWRRIVRTNMRRMI
jgi:cellobiose-specific phosphotransferase system component IIB